jgi:hypothetical protein
MTRPTYPVYPSTIMNGTLPAMRDMGPPDLYPSSSTAPYYQRRLDSMYGRHLAGLGTTTKRPGGDAEPAYAVNELRLLAEMDDVQDNGVFDPPGTRPNIYPDAGIMASSYSIPGYLARERSWAKSEVMDVNTGRPIVYVPSGAQSLDTTAQIAFIEGGAYNPPKPFLDMFSEERMRRASTVNVAQNPVPIGADVVPAPPPAAPSKLGTLMVALALVGVGAGAVVAFSMPKQQHTPNRRRSRRRR